MKIITTWQAQGIFKKSIGRIAVFTLAGGMALSRPLWDVAARSSFPAMPLFSDAYRPSGALDAILATFVLAFGAFVSIFPARKWIVVPILLCLSALCMRDLNRLQPWVWFSTLLSLVFLLSKKEGHARQATLLLLAGVYAWGGFHKMTPYFAEDNFVWFCEAFDITKPLGRYPQLGYGVAIFELLLAPGLLWHKTTRIAATAGIVFHLFIIAALSPVGLNWNAVVIPWNAGMTLLLLLFFGEKTGGVSSDAPLLKLQWTDWKQTGVTVILTAVWLAPLLNIAGLWPDPLSWKLYSNTQAEVIFYSGSINCDSSLEVFRQKNKFDGDKMLLDDWSNAELKTPLFSSERAFKQLGRYLCNCVGSSDSAGVYILRVKPWSKQAETLENTPCRGIKFSR